nr:hypothetical protein RTCK_04058 [Rhizobium sp. TCK]
MDRKSFAFQEWKIVREQMNNLLLAIWRLEMSTIAGLALYYGWLLTTWKPSSGGVEGIRVAALLAPTVFCIVVTWRLKIEYAILMRLARYSRRVEDFFYGRSSGEGLLGWQQYLRKMSPDRIRFSSVLRRYSHTFYVSLLLTAVTLTFAIWQISLAALHSPVCGDDGWQLANLSQLLPCLLLMAGH